MYLNSIRQTNLKNTVLIIELTTKNTIYIIMNNNKNTNIAMTTYTLTISTPYTPNYKTKNYNDNNYFGSYKKYNETTLYRTNQTYFELPKTYNILNTINYNQSTPTTQTNQSINTNNTFGTYSYNTTKTNFSTDWELT